MYESFAKKACASEARVHILIMLSEGRYLDIEPDKREVVYLQLISVLHDRAIGSSVNRSSGSFTRLIYFIV